MSALLWVIGCAEHGIKPGLLEKTLKSLHAFNRLACSDDGGAPVSEDVDLTSDDFYQGISIVGVLPNTHLGLVAKEESHKYITMVTSGYKLGSLTTGPA